MTGNVDKGPPAPGKRGLDSAVVVAAVERASEAHGSARRVSCDSEGSSWGNCWGEVEAGTGAPVRVIAGHLDCAERRLYSPLRTLASKGLLVRHETSWGLWYGVAPEGDELLAGLVADGREPELPESPEHRQWRECREEAREKLSEVRDRLVGWGAQIIEAARTDDGAAFGRSYGDEDDARDLPWDATNDAHEFSQHLHWLAAEEPS